jgi:hypothetical protein
MSTRTRCPSTVATSPLASDDATLPPGPQRDGRILAGGQVVAGSVPAVPPVTYAQDEFGDGNAARMAPGT